MKHVLLFDVNETLLDLRPLRSVVDEVMGEAGAAREWFGLLLHSSLATTLAGAYHAFGDLGGAALELMSARRGRSLPADAGERLQAALRSLPPHADAPRSLERLRAAGFRLACLSNSPPSVLQAQMENAGLAPSFEAVCSVDAVRRFKPAPEPYRMAARRLGVPLHRIRMIAAHDWDILGALQAGCAGAYVDRGAGYHPLYPRPDIMRAGLDEVAEALLARG